MLPMDTENYGFGGKGISFFTYGYFGSIYPTKKVQGCPGQLKFGKKHSCKWFPRQFFETINITCTTSPSKVANSQSFRSSFPASFHEKARLNVFCWPILLLFVGKFALSKIMFLLRLGVRPSIIQTSELIDHWNPHCHLMYKKANLDLLILICEVDFNSGMSFSIWFITISRWKMFLLLSTSKIRYLQQPKRGDEPK